MKTPSLHSLPQTPPCKTARRWIRLGASVGLAAALLAGHARDARAGSGRVNRDGTIDITLNFRYPPTAGDLTLYSNRVATASRVIWDATEGQMRLGNVAFTCGSVNEDLADVWLHAEDKRSGVSFWTDGSGLGRRGSHIDLFRNADGIVLAHELGHLGLGLADEYDEQGRFGECWGYGPCMEDGTMSEAGHCLMQQPGGFSQTEFCVPANHDLIQGDGTNCTVLPVPHGCTNNCEFFNHTTGRYETTQQTDISRVSCWAHLLNNFPWLTAPAGLPTPAPPAGFVNPTLINNCAATDTVMLILDRSGSMGWNTERDDGEVCGDGVDNDEDGVIDETSDCTRPRIEFLKAAARAWLALANNQGVRAGVVSFDDVATLDQPFQTVNDTILPALTGAVDALVPGGNTGIGTALLQTIFTFDAETAAMNKTAFLISDGINTDPPEPETVIDSLRRRGIRVFTISTGGASDDDTLTAIAGSTGGTRVDTHSASALVNAFAQQWANYRNVGTLIPQQPFFVTPNVKSNRFPFRVEFGANKLTFVVAGNMSEMSGFGVRALFRGPAGAGPMEFDSQVPSPEMRIVRDSFFTLVELSGLNPGLWTVELVPAPGAFLSQSGNLTVLSENPDAELFTSLDRYVVTNRLVPLDLRIEPIYHTTLRRVDTLWARVHRPDGSIKPVPLLTDFESGGTTGYHGLIEDFPVAGLYRVEVFMRTGPLTINDPGESIWAPAPEATVLVPELERVALETFFVPPFNPSGGDLEIRPRPDGKSLELIWSDPNGVLEEAAAINGPWKELPNAFSPHVVFPDAPRKFYRVRLGQPQQDNGFDIAPNQVSLVAPDGVTAQDLQPIADQYQLKLIRELPGNVFIFALPNPGSPEELESLLLQIEAQYPKLVVQTGLVVTPDGQGDPQGQLTLTDELVVQFHPHVTRPQIDALNAALGAQVRFENPFWKNHYLLRQTSGSIAQTLELSRRYAQSPLVEFAEPNFILPVEYRATIPNDALFTNQWHLHNTGQGGGTPDADIDAPQAWDITLGSSSVRIAVIDNGFDAAHPDLVPNLWVNPGEVAGNRVDDDGNGFIDDINGWDFNDNDNTLANTVAGGNQAHGTAAAGCAAARGNNLLGVSGSCPNGRLQLIRNGSTVMAQALSFDYARSNGAHIISCSWGYSIGTPTTMSVVDAINRAATLGRGGLGCIVLFAMNNSNVNDCAGATPDISSLPNVIGVSRATNRDRFDNSGFGNCMDVLGPTRSQWGFGTLGITTTDIQGAIGYAAGDYALSFGGTSAATPTTAGIAGLILSVNPTLNRLQVQQLLQDTTDKIEDSLGRYSLTTGFSAPAGGNATHGYGRVNAFEVVRVAAPAPAGRGGVDVFIRDNRLDWGNTEQPSNVLFEPTRGFIPHWQSVDIKVDAPPFAAPAPTTSAEFDAFADENPIESTNNRVYVRVRNRGPVTADSVRVKLHWVFAGAALPALPADFWSVFPADSADTSRWHSMGARTITGLAYSGTSVAGSTADAARIVQFNFPAPAIDPAAPAPDHYCLFAVIDSAQDRVSPASRLSRVPDLITPNDNNITHKNVSLQPAGGEREVRFYVRNPFDFPILTAVTHDGSPNLPLQLGPVGFNQFFQLAPGKEELFTVLVGKLDTNAPQTITVAQAWIDSSQNRLVLGGLTLEFGSAVRFGAPDLIVPRFEATGPATVGPQGERELPVRVVVRNQGEGPARIFKSAVEFLDPVLGSSSFVAAFTVPGQTDLWYPWTSAVLSPGTEVAFDGKLTFPSFLGGRTVTAWAVADSSSGDEFMPSWCRVWESNEDNNRSAPINLILP